MECRIGMTTDMAGREAYWRGRVPTLRNFRKIAGPFQSAADAQAAEKRLAAEQGCHAEPGGTGDGPWYVYRFEH